MKTLRPGKVVANDCRSVATRIERLSAAYAESHDHALLEQAACLLREIAKRFDPRDESS